MLNPISSPGDPLFYLHHAFIDKLWWNWQTADEEERLYAIGGPNVKDPNRPAPIPEGGMPSQNGASPALPGKRGMEGHHHARRHSVGRRAAGDAGNQTTLAHGISLFDLLPDVTAEDVMDVRNELLCYEYI